jgi:transposase
MSYILDRDRAEPRSSRDGRQWRRCGGPAPGCERVEAISERVRVGLATGHTDVRKGFANESLLMQEVLRRDPLSGHLFCFRGRRGDLLK